MTVHRPTNRGFTLIEMLVVIGIIGILVAILVPVIGMAITRSKNFVIASEISRLDAAVTAYKDKYGDYPPDFSDRATVTRHLAKCFPRIDAAEATRIINLSPSSATAQDGTIDPAEALVFWLGGLSDNPRLPFTGEGGPLRGVGTGPVTYYYNSDRNQGLFEFDQKRLSLQEVTIGSGIEWASIDEQTLHGKGSSDQFPVFATPGKTLPYVYFDARRYAVPNNSYPSVFTNDRTDYYTAIGTSNIDGVARPYQTNEKNPAIYNSTPGAVGAFYFPKRNEFQIISAGLDDDYGENIMTSSLVVFKRYAEGDGYQEGDNDNITNFSEGGKLEAKLP